MKINTTNYGFGLVFHPQGFWYLVEYLDENKNLGNSKMVKAFRGQLIITMGVNDE